MSASSSLPVSAGCAEVAVQRGAATRACTARWTVYIVCTRALKRSTRQPDIFASWAAFVCHVL